MQSMEVCSVAYEIRVVESLGGYPAMRLGCILFVKDTGDHRLNLELARALVTHAEIKRTL